MILKNFVVFEGLDGTGTTTQLRLLQQAFASRPAPSHTSPACSTPSCTQPDTVYFTCEPTDSTIGSLIRAVLSGAAPYSKKTLAYLFAADRCEHLYGKGGIIEQVQNGKAVFSDRYLFSSLAYQGIEAEQNPYTDTRHNLDPEQNLNTEQNLDGKTDLVRMLNKPFPLPEYLFFFELSAHTAMERIAKRNTPQEIYEKLEIQQRVGAAYRHILCRYAQTEPAMHIVRIDAAQTIAEIHQKIWKIIRHLPTL